MKKSKKVKPVKIKNVISCVEQLRAKKGIYYERWLDGMSKAAERAIKEFKGYGNR